MSQKSYDGSNALYLIPTPIGNMDDITLRSIHILKTVDVIFSEDTRVTSQLLRFLEIKKKTIASHKFNEETNKDKIIQYLAEGKNVGLVTDRGTPIISDPGYILSKYAIEKGYHVIGLPGPTALIPALIVSGLNPQPFFFQGFLNSKESKRKKELEELKKMRATIIFYEAPHRIEKMLKTMHEVLGNRRISISREITKRFEEVYRGTILEVLEEIVGAKGEMVIVVEGNCEEKTFDTLPIASHVNLYLKEGMDKKEAIKKVSKDRGIPKSEVYNTYHCKGESECD